MRLGLSTAALAALLIAGCDQPGNGVGNGTNGAASAPVDNSLPAQPTGNSTGGLGGNMAAGPAASAMPLTREYVAGRWSVTGNCTTPEFVFNADGSVARGGRNYQWRVDGGNLVVTPQSGGQSESTPVQVVDQTHMTVTGPEGPIPLTRCQ